MAVPADRKLAAARAASDSRGWREAFELYRELDHDGGLDAADLERLAGAAWWLGQMDVCIDARGRAFAQHLEASKRAEAAHLAVEIAADHFQLLQKSIGNGWLQRAERLVEEEPDAPARAYILRMRGHTAPEPEQALSLAREAYELAVHHGDGDLQAITLHDQGSALVALGRADEGMALCDEATAAAVSGELSPRATGIVYCNTIAICQSLGDYGRAGEWTEAAKRWCDRQDINGFPGICRVSRATVIRLRGALLDAEDEARRACTELEGFYLPAVGEGMYEIGEIRLRLGDLDAAEDAFRQAQELGRDPQPGLALVRLERGDVRGALAALAEALAGETTPLARVRLLPAQVTVALAAGDVEAAAGAAGELDGVARTYGTAALAAHAACARGAVLLARGDAEGAASALRAGRKLWHEVDAPYEAAEARVLLGRAHAAAGDLDAARLELETAASAFSRLGAEKAATRAREALAPAESARAERTFMFTDIVSSTDLVAAIGDASWSDLLAWHDRTLRACFARHGGEEVKHVGDGFFASFPDAESGLACAVEVQRTLAEHRREHGFALRLRIGVHAAEATRVGADYAGMGVNEAARIGALADGEQILASAATAESAGARFALGAPRAVALKGVPEPVAVVEVAWR